MAASALVAPSSATGLSAVAELSAAVVSVDVSAMALDESSVACALVSASCANTGFAAMIASAMMLNGTKRMCRSEEHTSELQSLMRISYAVFCLKKKKKQIKTTNR